MIWNDQAIIRLKQLWCANYGPQRIADIFGGGLSNINVMKKAWELKLGYREPSDIRNYTRIPELEIWPPPVVPKAPKILSIKPDKKIYPISTFVVPKYLRPEFWYGKPRRKAKGFNRPILLGKPHVDWDRDVYWFRPITARFDLDEVIIDDNGVKGAKRSIAQRAAPLNKNEVVPPVMQRAAGSFIPKNASAKLTRTTRVWTDEDNRREIEEFIAKRGVTKVYVDPNTPPACQRRTRAEVNEERHRIQNKYNRWKDFREKAFKQKVRQGATGQ